MAESRVASFLYLNIPNVEAGATTVQLVKAQLASARAACRIPQTCSYCFQQVGSVVWALKLGCTSKPPLRAEAGVLVQ
jgi:hypothetical protein